MNPCQVFLQTVKYLDKAWMKYLVKTKEMSGSRWGLQASFNWNIPYGLPLLSGIAQYIGLAVDTAN